MKKLNETIGSVEYDGLICGTAPAANDQKARRRG